MDVSGYSCNYHYHLLATAVSSNDHLVAVAQAPCYGPQTPTLWAPNPNTMSLQTPKLQAANPHTVGPITRPLTVAEQSLQETDFLVVQLDPLLRPCLICQQVRPVGGGWGSIRQLGGIRVGGREGYDVLGMSHDVLGMSHEAQIPRPTVGWAYLEL